MKKMFGIIVFYNIRGGNQVTFEALSEELQKPATQENTEPSEGSALELKSGAFHFVSEPRFIFVSSIFGCVFPRNRLPSRASV